MGYMIARIQLKYGSEALAMFGEAITEMLPHLEKGGWKLIGAYRNQIGRLYEVWHVWEVRDANNIIDARLGLRDVPGAGENAKKLAAVIESEELQYVEKLPYCR